ncbi:alpha-glucuronidase [Alkalihalobacillus alcalophilus ATCC 27647 = CGMCC 1.3604]|uniref:Xylan alpha-1,2-glucuronidase n=1 Tax=Alkalihalobacillus alcalophilus ATCC 27647 = CGMCC 1.3604 TaxID=1218173 RepID=A0A4S4K2D3_ALKAL|nr:alpha-glucuronidase family glycosyl hydrolase [Alkalihalobacillus alcalophilus]MED1560519.1 alpha-glucuronidase family glycosyl hydrolase [Alkalihalobacillus alcalophilus]THG91785.1 alpha-glucuronidase [Alkalihalobacillus alcalophilus ATCC 27647 = CGMCC 1.3604]
MIKKEKSLEAYKAWLRYETIADKNWLNENEKWLKTIVSLVDTELGQSAKTELYDAITKMSGEKPTTVDSTSTHQIVLATTENQNLISHQLFDRLNDEGYIIRTITEHEKPTILLSAKTDKGLLYASFHFLRLIQTKQHLGSLNIVENPKNQLRMINHWDNMDGSIERGYAGKSIFFENNAFTTNLERIKDYARILSSVGINAISINNVNVHTVETKLITDEFLPDVATVANIFRSYGIQTFLSINYASPIQLGQLTTADPLDPTVRNWWKEKAKDVYRFIPDFGGFVVKADSEHRPGPFTYERNHADGSNMLAEALEPFGGIVIWRCFVYNCMQDWRDRKTDRARAAYDHFKPLDGQFYDNVVLQIKNGPMDFQVREANSPLFGAMTKTNQILEFQVTQEYTGQQIDLCYLISQWKEILEFDTFAAGAGTPIKRIVDGSTFENKISGIAAVSNIGNDDNWTGHQLAQANLYGYGRLIWNPDLSTEVITDEWVRATFGHDPEVVEHVTAMLFDSWPIYENYTSPLGVGWMVNPNHHYGPNVDGYEYSVWGTYHFADNEGIGVDRTVSSGTGYTAQYFKENKEIYESLEICPDDLLLFFHHVPYTHKLQSGVTVIQHIYNTHFEGVEQAIGLMERWSLLKDKVDEERYQNVMNRLNQQIENAKQWRDMINTYFFRKSGIKDEKNRTIY